MQQRHQAETQAFLRAELRRLSVEVRKLRSENTRLRRTASTDSLTGIANRAAFRAKLNDAVRDAQASQVELSLLIIDVDEFNKVNNRFGHPAGDRVLRKIADLLRVTIRESDFVARYAGDEFVVLLPSTDQEDAQSIAERIRETVAKEPWPNAPVTISVGAATLEPSSLNARRLIREADRALYRAKAGGRNRVGTDLGSKSSGTMPMIHSFRTDIKSHPRNTFLRVPRSIDANDELALKTGT